MQPGNAKISVENWHYDKYKDPYEFPILDMSSENGSTDQQIDSNEASSNSSSVNLSKKIPQISDEKFKEILQRRKHVQKKNFFGNVFNKLNDVPQLAFKDKSDLLNLKTDTNSNNYINIHRVEESKENRGGILLNSSTPKLNTIISTDDKNASIKVEKNLSPFLSKESGITEKEKSEGNKKIDNYQFSKLIETLQNQTLEINELQGKLNKKDIQIENFENEIIKLQHDLSVFATENESLKLQVHSSDNENLKLNQLIAELKCSNEKLENKSTNDIEKSAKIKNDYKKEKLLLIKERDMNKSLILNYDNKIQSLNDENVQLLKSVETEKREVDYWKKKADLYEKESTDLKDKNEFNESEKSQLVETLKNVEKSNSDLKTKYENSQDHFNSLAHKYDNLVIDKKQLERNNENLDGKNQELRKKFDELVIKENQWSIDYIKLKAELATELKITQDELNSIKEDKHKLVNENQSLKAEVSKIDNEFSNMKNKIFGNDNNSITEEIFGDRYKSLEMNLIDELTLIEMQNILKNILSSFNIKFSELKQHIIFIRDDIFVFFSEIHSILHCTEQGNKIIVDKSIKLDTSDKEKLKQCMNILLNDVKKLKGFE
jgi:chromosome segregation ATPase